MDITKKQNEKIAFVAVTAILATSVMASIGILSSVLVQDTEGKNRHALDAPLKTEECKHDTNP